MQNTKLNRDQKILDNKYVICLRNMLGNGAFASVYKGHYSENPEKKIAIKLLNISKYKAKIQENILKNFQREQEIISKLNHPNIVQYFFNQFRFIDVCQSDDYYYLILEYCEEGNLKNILDKQPNRRLPFQQAFDVFSGIIHGYEALYRAKVIHRDLKPENIIFNNGIAKIADFGFAKIVDDMDEVNVHTFLGSPLYCAPEILEGKPYDSKADVWSLGCIFYEMLYGGAPFNAAHIQSLVKQAKKGISKFPLEVQVDENALNILKGMIQADTAQRLRWDQIFAHNYFKQYNPSVIFSQANATESQFIQAEIQKKNLEERLTLIDNNLKFQKEINEYLTKVAREAHQVMHWLKMSIENQILLFTSSAMMVFLIMCNLKKLIGGLPQQFEIGISQEDIKVLKEDRIKYNENLNWINSQFQSLAKYKEDLQQRTQQQENKFQPETVQLIKDLLNTKSINAKFIETYNKIIRQCIIEFYQKISSQQSSLLIQTMKSIIKLFYCLYPFKFRINQFEVVLLEGEINIKKENDLRETIEKLIKEYQLIIAH